MRNILRHSFSILSQTLCLILVLLMACSTSSSDTPGSQGAKENPGQSIDGQDMKPEDKDQNPEDPSSYQPARDNLPEKYPDDDDDPDRNRSESRDEGPSANMPPPPDTENAEALEAKYGISIPDSMTLGQSEDINLLIAIGMEDSNLISAVLAHVPEEERVNWQVLTEEIKVGSKMRARLIDPTEKAFEIRSITEAEQYVELERGQTTEWAWTVTPLEAGVHDLRLVIEILYGTEALPRSVEVTRRSISVITEGRIKTLIQANRQAPARVSSYFLIGGSIGLLIFGGLLIWMVLRRRQKQDGETPLPANASFIEKTRFFIKQGELTQALEVLRDEYEARLQVEETEEEEEVFNTVLLQLSRLNQVKKNASLGMTDQNEVQQTQAQVGYAILQLLDEIEEMERQAE